MTVYNSSNSSHDTIDITSNIIWCCNVLDKSDDLDDFDNTYSADSQKNVILWWIVVIKVMLRNIKYFTCFYYATKKSPRIVCKTIRTNI